jgi:glycerate 2-kinase
MLTFNAEQSQNFLQQCFSQAVAATQADTCLPAFLPVPPLGRTVVIGAGKAAAAMAHTLEQHWHGELSGVVITRYGHTLVCRKIEVIEAAHPVPDHAGFLAAQKLAKLVTGLQADDLVICLLSGGGSALMAVPAPCLSMQEKQELTRALLRSGASIHEINCVRKHLSAIKGGRLALACAPARVLTLMISDVAGDDASIIASGPTLPDASTCADALAILTRFAIPFSERIRHYLMCDLGETPKPGDTLLAKNSFHIVARAQDALQAAANFAEKQGVEVQILSDSIEGEARDCGRIQAAIALDLVTSVRQSGKPLLLLSGGETSVTMHGNGRGGRNTEYLLSLCIALSSHTQIFALAADTDGIDGSENNAGAIITPATLSEARQHNMLPQDYLDNNDAYTFFEKLGQLLVTGPTLTNVNDFRAILILPA